jgi:hypothetical protein
VARDYPPVFLSLLARVLPLQVQVDAQTEVTYRSVAEVEREMASRGFSFQEILPLLTQSSPIKEEGGDADGSAGDQGDEA